MKQLTLAFMALALFSCTPKEENRPPNIIHIFADDLGYGDIGCFGATDIATPNIDQIAQEGIKFTDFYSASHVCSPSRAALMTGRLPQRMGIHGVFFPESFTGMPNSEFTIAELLKQRNYVTGMVGKWHLGHREEFLPLAQGFDSYYGIPYSNDMASVVYMQDNKVDSFEVNQHYSTKTYTKKALEFIDSNAEKPFFLYLAHNMPHVPIYASEQFEGTSQRGLYGDVIQELDWSVGQVLAKLKEKGLLENTLVIFSSDNGPWLVMEDHGGSAGPLREGKQYTFEGGMRVPTVAMWKGKIPAGKVYNNIASQMDWFPTIAKLSNATIPADLKIDGEDLSEVLLGNGERKSQTYIYFDKGNPQAYRSGKYKIKEPYQGYKGSRGMKEVAAHDTLLFDLSTDIHSANNLYPAQKDLAIKLFAEKDAAFKALGELPPAQVLRSNSDKSHYEYLNNKHEKTGKMGN
ncbi:Arylsulfatase A [Spirosomataceae bacterium TFI 002]|nr:Arylsulfatase A [Spirosomataceae bacterium TFI 002]